MKTVISIVIGIAGILFSGHIFDPSPIDEPNSYDPNIFESLGRTIIGIIVLIITIGVIYLINKNNNKIT